MKKLFLLILSLCFGIILQAQEPAADALGFKVSSTSVRIFSTEGSKSMVNIISNTDWYITSDQPWLTVSPTTGNGNNSLIFTATANPIDSLRIANITIIGNDESIGTVTIVITQEPLSSTKSNFMAGGLSSAYTTDEKNTITNLVITGSVDARDFKTMRDEMPLLAEIDLREATVVAYNGILGTAGIYDVDYKANAIPKYAFYNPVSYVVNSSLTTILLPISVTSIESSAFYYCSSLASVTIPSQITSIKDNVFQFCNSLNNISIPASVSFIENSTFFYSSSLINVDAKNLKYSSNSGVLFDKTQETLLHYPNSISGNYIIPSSVTSLGDYSFLNCNNVTSVIIPSSVILIKDFVFAQCTGLQSVYSHSKIPIDLTAILGVFSGVNTITCTLYVPFGSKAAYQAAPQWQDFTNIVEMAPSFSMPLNITAGNLAAAIPQTVRDTLTYLSLIGTIDARDFKTMRDSLPMLSEIDLSRSMIVTYEGTEGTNSPYYSISQANVLPQSSFRNPFTYKSKTDLTNIILPNTLLSIGDYAFSNCTGLTTITLPSSLSEIGYAVFYECSGLKSISIPISVTSIGEFAFTRCVGLTSINIPSTVTSIGENAFVGNSCLVTVQPNSLNFSSNDGILFNKTQTELIYVPNSKTGTYVIPSSVTEIGSSAFLNCKGLKAIEIPSSIISIGSNAFWGCSGLTSVFVPETITSISEGTFSGCIGLTYFIIPKLTTSIDRDAFYGCLNLTSISIPYTVRNIDIQAFAECRGLRIINVEWHIPLELKNDTYVFNRIDKTNCVLNVPFGSKAAYQTAEQWKDFTNIVEMAPTYEMPLNVTAGGLASLLPQSVRDTLTYLSLTGTIDARDFKTMRDEMPLLAELDISGSTIVAYSGNEGTNPYSNEYSDNEIPNNSFYYGNYLGKECLRKVKLPENLIKIGSSAFSYCKGLISINIPNQIHEIKVWTFIGCSGLKSLTFPETLVSVGESALGGCTGIDSLRLPPSFLYIGNWGLTGVGDIIVDQENPNFSSCDGVLFNKNKTTLVQCPNNKAGLYSIPATVKSIGFAAFSGCNLLKKVFMPPSVIDIGYQTFYNCKGLNSINISESVISIQDLAFAYCTGLDTIIVNNTIPIDLSSSTMVYWGMDKNDCVLLVPYGSKGLYQSANQWKDFSNIVEMEPNNLNSGLVAYYPFNGNANDESGNGNNGTVIGNVSLTSDRFANQDKAYEFPGIPLNYIKVENSSTLALDTFTISAWIYTESDYGFGVVVNKNRDINNGHYGLYTNAVCGTVLYSGSNGTRGIDQPSLSNWHMVTGTIIGDKATFFFDGSYKTDTTLSSNFLHQGNDPLTIGMHYYTGVPDFWAYPYKGRIDDVSIYNRALSPVEIDSLYHQGGWPIQPPKVDLDSGLVAYYPFNGNANDESGNNMNATHENEINFNTGILGQAIHIDACEYVNPCGGRILLPNIDFNAMSQFTVSLWVNEESQNSPDGEAYIFFGDHGLGNIGILHSPGNNDSIYFSVGSVKSSKETAAVKFDGLNKWQLYTMTYDKTNVNVYVNGQFATRFKDTVFVATSDAGLGTHWWWSGTSSTRLTASFDDIRIYNRALNDLEIDSLFRQANFQNTPPIANAGPDQSINEGTSVSLDGSASVDPEGKLLNYFWKAPCGIVLDSYSSASPSFTAPGFSLNSEFVFKLIVNDGSNDSEEDQVVIKINDVEPDPILPEFPPIVAVPIAVAGNDQNAKAGSIVTLDGSGSHGDYNLHLYSKWTAPQGVSLSSNCSVNPSFTVPHNAVGTSYTFSLTVNDGCFNSNTDYVTISIVDNSAPTANAGPDQSVNERTIVTLDGSASADPEGDALIYTWNVISKNVNLTSTNTAQTSFIAPEVESSAGYIVSLTVSDGFLTSEPDTILILVNNVPNKANVDIYKTSVTPVIDGIEDNIWNSVNAIPIDKNFGSELPTVEAYWKALWTDSGLYVLINVKDDNHWPAWESGGNFYEYDWSEIFLDVNDTLVDGLGFGSFYSGHYSVSVVYEENQYGSLIDYFPTLTTPGGFTSYRLTGENLVREHFLPFSLLKDKNGRILDKNRILELKEIGFDITIDDQDEGITTSRQRKVWQSNATNNDCYYSMDGAGTITFMNSYINNIAPIANAGSDQSVNEDITITLDGSASSDPDGDQLTYLWTAPAGITLSSATTANPTFTAPEVSVNTDYTFSLVVNDGMTNSAVDQVMITVLNSPKHFTPIWTGNGTDHMNINIYSVTLDGVELEAGDEIGIFDGNICVGVGTLTDTVTHTNTLDMAVSRNDGSGNGYTSGNAISYKLFDRSNELELSNVTAVYASDDASWSTDGMFAIGLTAFAELSGVTSVNQDIALNMGWNIISANVVPENLNLKDIFQTLIDAGTLKKVMDETGKTIENFGSFGGWKNTIGNLNSGKGYKVNVTAPSTLSLEGTPVSLPLDLTLNTGWNIISYPAFNLQDAKEVVQALIDAGKLKKVMDESGKTIENFGSFGGWKNSIGNFTPGKGYKVSVTEICKITIPVSGTKSAVIVPEVLASEHFKPVFIGNGTDHMNVNLVNLQASGLLENDQIGVFDGKLCVGSVTIGAAQLMAGSISIAASSNDEPGEAMNGFTTGHRVELQLYRGNQTYQLSLTKVGGYELFEKNESLFAQVNTNELTAIQILDESAQFKCYPNPFTREMTIEVQNSNQADITVEIYNMAGQRIKNLYEGHTNGNLLLKWNGANDSGQKVAPGVYLCKVNGMVKQVIFEGGKREK